MLATDHLSNYCIGLYSQPDQRQQQSIQQLGKKSSMQNEQLTLIIYEIVQVDNWNLVTMVTLIK